MKTFYEYIEHLDQHQKQNLQEVGFAQLAGLGAAAAAMGAEPTNKGPHYQDMMIGKNRIQQQEVSPYESKLFHAPTPDDFKAEAEKLGKKLIESYNKGIDYKIAEIINGNDDLIAYKRERLGDAFADALADASELRIKTIINFGEEQKTRFKALISSRAFVTLYYIKKLDNLYYIARSRNFNQDGELKRNRVENLEKILNSVNETGQRKIRKLRGLINYYQSVESIYESGIELIFCFDSRLKDNFDIDKLIVDKKTNKKTNDLPPTFLRSLEEIEESFADSHETNPDTFYLPKNLSPEFVQELRAIENQLPAVQREISRLPITMEDFKDGPRAR
jgi:hypothetical protein